MGCFLCVFPFVFLVQANAFRIAAIEQIERVGGLLAKSAASKTWLKDVDEIAEKVRLALCSR